MKITQHPKSFEELLELLVSTPIDFILTTVDASTYVSYTQHLFEANVLTPEMISPSKVIGYTSESHIAYKKSAGNDQGVASRYRYSDHDKNLNIALIVVSLFLVIKNKSPGKFLHYFYELYSVMLKQNLSRSLKDRSTSTRIILYAYLISTLFIVIEFTNLVLEKKVILSPDRVIDSWRDLYKNHHVEIAALEQDTLTQFARASENKMSRDFMSRLTVWQYQDWYNDNILLQLAVNMTTGQTAMVKSRITLKFLLLQMSQLLKSMFWGLDIDSDFLESMHISKEGAWNLPYFIPARMSNKHPYVLNLNKM